MAQSTNDSNARNATNIPNNTSGPLGGKVGGEGPTISAKFWDWVHRHRKGITIVLTAVVIGADVYLAYTQGISTLISALAAEGTLTLALVTYLQMELGKQRQRP